MIRGSAPWEGATAIVGNDASSGAAYIYVEGAITGTRPLTATLSDPAMASSDGYGTAVAISGTGPGGTTVVGASGAFNDSDGAAYIFVEGATPGTWTSTTLSDPGATAQDEFGGAVSVSGSAAIIGSEGLHTFAGAAYLYS
jgi:hypothetical protein